MNKNLTAGLILIIIGAVLLIQRTMNIDIHIWSFVWPLFLIIPGIAMHINYFSDKSHPWNLFVAGILIVYGAGFFIDAVTNWQYTENLAFIFPLGIGIGFFESYAFGGKNKFNFAVSLLFLVIALYGLIDNIFPQSYDIKAYIIPAVLIIIGVFLIFRRRQ